MSRFVSFFAFLLMLLAAPAQAAEAPDYFAPRTGLDADTVLVRDPLPAQMALRVADFGGAGSGPIAFADGAVPSGLSYTFASLSSAGDDIEFSSDHGATWTYAPTPNADGTDPASADRTTARRPRWSVARRRSRARRDRGAGRA